MSALRDRGKPISWLIAQLKKEKEHFEDEVNWLAYGQVKRVEACDDLLKEGTNSLAKGSKKRRSARLRVRSLLVDAFLDVGQEVFLLCTLAVTISNLATIQLGSLVPKLRDWWKSVSHR